MRRSGEYTFRERALIGFKWMASGFTRVNDGVVEDKPKGTEREANRPRAIARGLPFIYRE
jgi:hypothetical protein